MFRVEEGLGFWFLGTWYESLLFGATIATQKEKDRTFSFLVWHFMTSALGSLRSRV